MKRKAKRPRQRTYAALKRDLDKWHSLWVRRSNADRNGNVSCYTCQLVLPWKSSHAGHWIPRHHLATRWHESNVKTQCPPCNLFRKGLPHVFAHNLMDDYGPEIIDHLIRLSRQPTKLSRGDLTSMIQEYQEKLKGLVG